MLSIGGEGEFSRYGSWDVFRQRIWRLASLKVTDIVAVQYATYDFLVVFHYKYVSILHRFRDIISYFQKFK